MNQTIATRRKSSAGKGKLTNVMPIRIQIEDRTLKDLVIDPGNPRQHSQKQIKQVASSIQEFGFLVPVIVDGAGRVVAGHARILAAKDLGLITVPVIEARHLSPAQLKAFRLADNKLASNSSWDERLLAQELIHLTELDLDFDLEITGFAAVETDLLIQDFNSPDNPMREEETALTGVSVCKEGDLWILGDHRVICADAKSDAAFQAVLESERAEMVFVDPPFNVPIDGHVSGNGKTTHREFAEASGEMTAEQFTLFLRNSCSLLSKFSVNGAIHFVCMDWRHSSELLAAGREVYSELKNVAVWVKDRPGMGSLYRSQHEFIFVFKSGRAPHINNIELGKHGRNRSNVWPYDSAATQSRKGNRLLDLHPTAKPVDMVMDAILDCSDRGGIVLDAFLGSGTTLLAAERTGRRCRGIEIDPLYIDTAIRRWQNLTGLDARRASDSKTFREIEAEAEQAHE